jgi:hypothetical protein
MGMDFSVQSSETVTDQKQGSEIIVYSGRSANSPRMDLVLQSVVNCQIRQLNSQSTFRNTNIVGSTHLEIPNEIWFHMVTIEMIIEQFPVSLNFYTLSMLPQDHYFILRLLLLHKTKQVATHMPNYMHGTADVLLSNFHNLIHPTQ